MQAAISNTNSNLNLAPFRRRIRLLRVSRSMAMSGTAGAIFAVVMAALDYFGVRYFALWHLAIPLLLGLAAGAAKALLERLPDSQIARSVDKRAGLEDRLTTAAEIPATSGPLANAQHQDAAQHLTKLRARDLYRLRLNRWHGSLFSFSALSILVFLLGNTPILRSFDARKEAAELKQIAQEVQQVTKPVLEEAKKANATDADKELARRLEQFTQELQKARMSKQDALLKANQLAEDAKKLQQPKAANLANTVQMAQTAAAKLEKMQERSGLEKSDELKQAAQEAAQQKEIDDIEKKLAALQAQKAEKGEISAKKKAERAEAEKKLAQAKQNLKNIQLSRKAQEILQKLQSMPEFKEAQELLSKLAASAAAQQAGEMSEMTPEQMEAAAKRMEELAKKLNTDAKMKEFVKQMLEAAKAAKLSKNGGLGAGLLGAFGLGLPMRGPGGFSLGGMKGAGGTSDDRWVGAHGKVQKDDKSSLLNVKLQDRVITSQIGDKGPQTYTETLGPSKLGGKSGIPYQKALPKYEKSAETALQKSDIPPRLRGKVRDYFDALRK